MAKRSLRNSTRNQLRDGVSIEALRSDVPAQMADTRVGPYGEVPTAVAGLEAALRERGLRTPNELTAESQAYARHQAALALQGVSSETHDREVVDLAVERARRRAEAALYSDGPERQTADSANRHNAAVVSLDARRAVNDTPVDFRKVA